MSSSKAFPFKDIDSEGRETLEAISAAPRLNEWMYHAVSVHLCGHVLEVGSGIGNISRYFIGDDWKVTLTDIRDDYVRTLKEKFGDTPQVENIFNLDLVHPDFDQEYAAYLGTFDGLFALNVVEHIEDDALAIANCKKLIRPGGTMVILVPAYQGLYNRFDQELFHSRRYNRTMLGNLFQRNGLKTVRLFHFNMAGILGWFVSGKLQKNKTIPKDQMKIYNALVPAFKAVDAVTAHQVGLSCVGVAQRPLEK